MYNVHCTLKKHNRLFQIIPFNNILEKTSLKNNIDSTYLYIIQNFKTNYLIKKK